MSEKPRDSSGSFSTPSDFRGKNIDWTHSIENWITFPGLLTALLLLVHCMLQRRKLNTKDPLVTKARLSPDCKLLMKIDAHFSQFAVVMQA